MFVHKLRQLRKCSTINRDKPFYVTTPIFYVNAAPHIGHLYSAVIADTICRYERLRGITSSVQLCTGTDEHGSKIQQSALQHNVPIEKYCDDISLRYRKVFQQAQIGFTDFIRTTEERHKNAVATFWTKLNSKGCIYSSEYSGWYCVSDETFLTDNQLRLDEGTGVRYSLESGHPVEWTKEKNYMFKLNAVQNDVLHWLRSGNRIRPKIFEKTLLTMLSEPLQDVSVSRPISRVHWGIPVPNDSTQTIYVWLDALINYLTSAGYPDEKYRMLWPPDVQVIGKDILKFHGIYWPAFLIAADLEPPRELFVHSHWTVEDQKMSKSKGNVVDPVEASKVYSMEGLRYFLLREGVAHSDGNYSSTKALRILNSELADTLGNLLSRACAKSLNPRQIYPRLHQTHLHEILQSDAAQRLKHALQQLGETCGQHYNDRNFYLVVDNVISTLHTANNFFESMRPWELKSQRNDSIITNTKCQSNIHNNGNAERLETIIAMTMDTLRLCGIVLQPIVPFLCERLLDRLSVPEEKRLWRNLCECFANEDVNNDTITITITTANSASNNVSYAQHERELGNATNAVLFQRILLKDENGSKTPNKKRSTQKQK